MKINIKTKCGTQEVDAVSTAMAGLVIADTDLGFTVTHVKSGFKLSRYYLNQAHAQEAAQEWVDLAKKYWINFNWDRERFLAKYHEIKDLPFRGGTVEQWRKEMCTGLAKEVRS